MLRRIAALLLASSCLVAVPANAQDATWLANPGTGAYDISSNWNPATVPTGTATFGASTRTNISNVTGTVGAWSFISGGLGYTFTMSAPFSFTGAGISTAVNSGVQQLNVSNSLDFYNSSSATTKAPTAGVATISQSNGVLTFHDNSTAGAATIDQTGSPQLIFLNSSSAGDAQISGSSAGNINAFIAFRDNSTSGNATIDTGLSPIFWQNNATAGNASIFNSYILNFQDSATAGAATFSNNSGTINFTGSSNAGTASIANNGVVAFAGNSTADHANILTFGGKIVTFADSSTAGNATITNSGGLTFSNTSSANHATITNGSTFGAGSIIFNDSSTAGHAVINHDSASPGITRLTFNNNSTAGDATINYLRTSAIGTSIIFNDTTTAGNATISSNGNLLFNNNSSAGSATITNLAFDSISLLSFSDTSTAGSAKIDNRSGIFFQDNSTAANATIANSTADGFVSFTATSTAANAIITATTGGRISFSGTSTAASAKLSTAVDGRLSFSGAATAANAVIDNLGSLQFLGTATAANATITNAGTFLLGNFATAGNATIANSGTLTFLNTSTGGNATLTQTGNATTTFNSAGPANNGKLSIGSLAGWGTFDLTTRELTVGSNNLSTNVTGVIIGAGSLVKTGTGNLILSGVNTYTGATSVNAGILSVNGSIVSSSGVTVNAGGTLGGNGALPSVTVNGGTLAPGNSIGTITINGNLTIAGAGNYFVEVSGVSADRTNVTGTATLAGGVTASFSGTGLSNRYLILSAAGGRTGTFNTLSTVNLPSAFSARLDYTNTDVLLTLSLTLDQIAGLNRNQQSVASTIAAAFNSGTPLNGSFAALLSLPAAALPGALSQLTGEVATGGATASFRTADQFLGLMLDPFLETRAADGTTTGRALALAPETAVMAALPAELLGYSPMITKAPPMSAVERRWTAWGAAYGARGKFNGDATAGSQNLDLTAGGFVAGIDYRVTRDTTVGFAASGGATNWSLDNGLGSGRSDVVQGGVYASTRFNNAYLSAALAYGRSDLTTDRNIVLPGLFDRLTASFAGNTVAGRIEGGYRFAVAANWGVTPYAALQAQGFHTDAFSERDLTGLAGFALNYADRTVYDTRSELGARFDSRMLVANDVLLVLRARAAWGHGFDTGRSAIAAFQALPGTNFTVLGASAARDAALVSGGAELRLRNGVQLSAKFDGEFSGRTSVYAGTAAIRVNW